MGGYCSKLPLTPLYIAPGSRRDNSFVIRSFGVRTHSFVALRFNLGLLDNGRAFINTEFITYPMRPFIPRGGTVNHRKSCNEFTGFTTILDCGVSG